MDLSIESLYQVGMPALNLSESVDFYGSVMGLSLIARFEQPVELAFFQLGSTRLMLEKSDEKRSGGVIYLQVSSIEERVAELKAKGVEVLGEPRAIHHDVDGTFGAAGESEYMAFINDPAIHHDVDGTFGAAGESEYMAFINDSR